MKLFLKNGAKPRLKRLGFLSLVAALSAGLAGCGGGGDSLGGSGSSQTYYGNSQTVGNGFARSYMTFKNGAPQAIGMQFNADALANWPQAGPPTFATEYRLALPKFIEKTPFTAISVYATYGHPPDEVYGNVPHIHPIFFITSGGENDQITMTSTASDTPVAADETPPGHVSTHFALPDIGVIYSDPSDPHANEVPFHTYDMDFGFFNGHLNSENLTLSNVWLNQKLSITENIPVPQKYPKPGYYPTTYSVSYDPAQKTYDASLGGFAYFAG